MPPVDLRAVCLVRAIAVDADAVSCTPRRVKFFVFLGEGCDFTKRTPAHPNPTNLYGLTASLYYFH